jgi:fibronectin-binding autotransporter adhesin
MTQNGGCRRGIRKRQDPVSKYKILRPQKRGRAFCWAVALTLSSSSIYCSSASAAITFAGNVTPDPHTTTSTSTLNVANTTAGTLTIDGGSTVTSGLSYIGNSFSANGVVNISGTNSTWNAFLLFAGYNGSGTLHITNGGAANFQGMSLGENAGSTGSLSVSDPNSLLTTQSLTVGNNGVASMTVTNGGKVMSGGGELGQTNGSGTATIDGLGTTWQLSGDFVAGNLGQGKAFVQNGATLSSLDGLLGIASNSSGTVALTGAQSVWNITRDLTVGASGKGTLQVFQGATVNASGDTMIGRDTSGGEIDFDNGVLNTGGLLTGINSLQGTGNISTHGLVTDINLAFDSTHPLQQQFVFTNYATQNVTVNLNASAVGSMGAGFQGQGSLSIADGLVVNSKNGYLGYRSGSNGVAIVTGAGSAWNITADLAVGLNGVGSLTIQNGGAVQVARTTTVDSAAGSGISFSNGTLTTQSLITGVTQLLGTGTINTLGLVTDSALVFDQTHPSQQQIVFASQPNQNVTVNLNADGAGIMGAGVRAQGSLSIAGGVTLSAAQGYLGYGAGSTGTATVSGPGSTWSMTGALSIGPAGVGYLTVSNGGAVADANAIVSNGKAIITDPSSVWTNPQDFSVSGNSPSVPAPEVVVSNGGKLVSQAGLFSSFSASTIGGSSGNSGKVTVDGVGSRWVHTGSLTIGSGGALVVSNGGALSSGAGTLGSNSIGSSSVIATAIVTGHGSSWVSSDVLTIGTSFTSSLTITDGGNVTSTAGAITSNFSFGELASTVNIAGPGSNWSMTGALAVGGTTSVFGSGFPGGPGTLTLGPGGSVHAGNTTIFMQGAINLQGGNLYATAIAFNGAPPTNFNWTSGTLHVGTFNGDLVNSAGVLSPGASPGKTTITGTYTQLSNASLQIELAGTTSGTQYDFVNISGTGNSTLGGALQLSLLNGFLPSPSDTFTVLSAAGNLLGSFSNVPSGSRLATSDGLGSFLVSYGAGSSFNAKQVVLSNFVAVPEPSTLAMVCLLLGSIASSRSRLHS